ncbi:MAG: sulfite exporter TauE/SafE family protein [Phycisphaerales bacterium]|nr:sulfite exporter TauE/SafE family protein [Phycisphaerales bacterium]
MIPDILSYSAVVLTAGVAAAVNAMAGGGTFFTFPALTGLAGLSEKVANMTSATGIWPGTAASTYAAREDLQKIPHNMLATFGTISLIGGILGALLLIYTPNETFKLVIPWLLLFATVIFGFSKPISRWAAKNGAHTGHSSIKWTVFVGMIQLVIAIYGGYFGAGIGVLMLAGLSFAGLESLHQVNALKSLLSCLINAMSIIVFIVAPLLGSQSEQIFWPLAGTMAIAATLGGFVGMQIARKMKADKLRILILTIGVLLTAAYFYKSYFAS